MYHHYPGKCYCENDQDHFITQPWDDYATVLCEYCTFLNLQVVVQFNSASLASCSVRPDVVWTCDQTTYHL